MRGFDPDLDRLTLIREDQGRRTNPLEPARSLLLQKPTMEIAHGGGRRLRRDDLAYGILRTWIAARCPDDAPGTPACERIELVGESGQVRWPERERRLRVRAWFQDGSARDITALTVFSSSDEQVATVDAEGLVTSRERGETTVVARYLDFFDTVRLHFDRPVPDLAWQAPPVRNEIDQRVFARLERLRILPSQVCSDHEFVRRVYLDLLGILPTRAEAEAFLADDSTDKRDRLIDLLLERPEHAEFWAQKWADLLRVKGSRLGLPGVHKFHRWLVAAIRDNMPYDRLVTELLTSQGSTHANPPASFFRAAGDPNECAESVSQLFLGIRIQCAKCHNHPFDRWSQDNYYGISAFFDRVRRQPVTGSGEVFVWLADDGETVQPRTGREVVPWLPLEGPIDDSVGEDAQPPTPTDRRVILAEWLARPDNPFFARVAVNRIWGQLFGRGIVEPVDDFRADNPPSHPELLEWLAARFVESGFDQKQLIRRICRSGVYQLSSRTNEFNEGDDKYFSHAYARLLSAEQLLDAICQVTGVPERFGSLPAGTRATGLPAPDYGGDFLKLFGRPARNTVCECERIDGPSLARALQLINSPLIARKLHDRNGRLSRWLDNVPARLAAAGEPPREGLVAWFRADSGVGGAGVGGAGSSPAGDGQPVAVWKNLARPLANLEQPVEARRPAYVDSSLGGLPAVRFDGNDDWLHNTASRLLPPDSARTVVVVGRLEGETGGALFTFGRARQNGSSVFTAQHVQVGGSYYVYSDGVNASGNTTAPGNLMEQLRQPFVTSFRSGGIGTKLEVRVNGSSLPVTQPGAVGADRGSDGFTLGSREDIPPGDQSWDGLISELLVYGHRLEDRDLETLGAYLSTKYDLATAYGLRDVPLQAGVSDEEIITDLYLAAFSRGPDAEEMAIACEHLRGAASRSHGLRDIAWSLLNSKEFLFQH